MTAPHPDPASEFFTLEHIPALLSLGQVARALNLSERTVRNWFDKQKLESVQLTPNSWRYVRPHDLATFAARYGLSLKWETLL